jgi:hypothetical protein
MALAESDEETAYLSDNSVTSEDRLRLKELLDVNQVPREIPTESPESKLATAIIQAIKTVTPSHQEKNGEINRLLVRQSIGKELPSFSSEPREWPSFITQFRKSM